MADLIDRAALLEQLDNLHNHCGHCDGYGYISKDKAMQKVKSAPAVDAVEVKRGKWSHVAGGRTICNQCGEYPLYDYFGKLKFSNYCPRCGAKMEGIDATDRC